MPQAATHFLDTFNALPTVTDPKAVRIRTDLAGQMSRVVEQLGSTGDVQAGIASINQIMRKSGAQIAELLSALQPLCPVALRDDELHQADLITLGVPIPGL
jgi:hypothetical protein